MKNEYTNEGVHQLQNINELIQSAIQALNKIPAEGTQNYGTKQEIDDVEKNALTEALPYLKQLTIAFPTDMNLANLFGRTEQYIKEFTIQGYANFTAHSNETIRYLLQLKNDRHNQV